MRTIIQYISQPAAFDPEAISVMSEAYDRAILTMVDPQAQTTKELIAARIISQAAAGERDPGKLCNGALAPVSSVGASVQQAAECKSL